MLFFYFGVFDIFRLSIWRLDVLNVMTFRFWIMIFGKILSLRFMLVFCKLGLNLFVLLPRSLSVGVTYYSIWVVTGREVNYTCISIR